MEVYSFTEVELTAFANKVKDMLSSVVDNKLDEILVVVGKPSRFGRFLQLTGVSDTEDSPDKLRIALTTQIKVSEKGE